MCVRVFHYPVVTSLWKRGGCLRKILKMVPKSLRLFLFEGVALRKKITDARKSVVICWVRRFLSLLYCNLQRRHSWLDRVSCGPLQVEPLWLRTSICCAFLECVIAQRRVSSGPVRGSPRTEQHARVGRWERRKSEWKATLHQTRSLRGTFGRSPIPGRADSRHARGDRREQVNFH